MCSKNDPEIVKLFCKMLADTLNSNWQGEEELLIHGVAFYMYNLKKKVLFQNWITNCSFFYKYLN